MKTIIIWELDGKKQITIIYGDHKPSDEVFKAFIEDIEKSITDAKKFGKNGEILGWATDYKKLNGEE